MPYGFINDRAAKLLITDKKLREYVCLIISKLLKLNYNNEYQSEYIAKNNMYVFHLCLRQLKPGEKENKIKPVYQININNYDIYKKGEFIYKTQLCETTYHCVRDNNLVIYDINMDFLKKLSYNEIDVMPSDSLEKLFLVFYNRKDINYEQFYNGNPLMKRVVKRLEEMWKDFDDMLYYDAEELRKQVDDRLRKERDAEIEKEVIQKVTSEVTQKVTSEVTNAIALKMIKDGLSKEQVINYSQISDEEYETLKNGL